MQLLTTILACAVVEPSAEPAPFPDVQAEPSPVTKTVVLIEDNFHKEPTVAPTRSSDRVAALLALDEKVPPPPFPPSPQVDTWDERELVTRLERLGGDIIQSGSSTALGKTVVSARTSLEGADIQVRLVQGMGEPFAGWTKGVYTAAVARGEKQGLFVTVRREAVHRTVAKQLGLDHDHMVAPDVVAVADALSSKGYRLLACHAGDFEVFCSAEKGGRIVELEVYGELMGDPGTKFIAGLMMTGAHHSMELDVAEPARSVPMLESLLSLPPTPPDFRSPWLD